MDMLLLPECFWYHVADGDAEAIGDQAGEVGVALPGEQDHPLQGGAELGATLGRGVLQAGGEPGQPRPGQEERPAPPAQQGEHVAQPDHPALCRDCADIRHSARRDQLSPNIIDKTALLFVVIGFKVKPQWNNYHSLC